jgi:predicted nuclease of restriction endonuclease-like RecB superfamily
MLTADLVHTRRKGDRLHVIPLGARREQAVQIADELLDVVRAHVGRTREELDEALSAVEVEPRDDKLKQGLFKLLEDELDFEVDATLDPPALRGEVFARAAEARRGGSFDRAALLGEVGAAHGIAAEALERALYADLKSAHVIRAEREVGAGGAEALVRRYERAQPQAVLLRASEVRVSLVPRDAASLRSLFRKLKFLGLFATITREGKSVHLRLDGPFSLFAQTTKYGIALAQALPSIAAAGAFELEADLRWGKERLPLRFELSSKELTAGDEDVPARLSDDAQSLFDRWLARQSPWRVKAATELLDAPGHGVVVPDLVFEHDEGGRVYLEVMGFSARDAVFDRVALVEKGLLPPIVLCASERLRVSEAVLPDDASAALLVYKGVIPIGALEEKLDRLRRR